MTAPISLPHEQSFHVICSGDAPNRVMVSPGPDIENFRPQRHPCRRGNLDQNACLPLGRCATSREIGYPLTSSDLHMYPVGSYNPGYRLGTDCPGTVSKRYTYSVRNEPRGGYPRPGGLTPSIFWNEHQSESASDRRSVPPKGRKVVLYTRPEVFPDIRGQGFSRIIPT